MISQDPWFTAMRPGPRQLHAHQSTSAQTVRLVLPLVSSARVKSGVLPRLPSAYGMVVSRQKTVKSVKLVLKFQIVKINIKHSSRSKVYR